MSKVWVVGLLLLGGMVVGQPMLSFSRSEVAGGGGQANAFAISDFNGDSRHDDSFPTGEGTYVMLGRGVE